MELLNLDVVREYGGALLQGLAITVVLTFIVITIALVLAIPVAAGGFLTGTAADIIEQLKAVEKAFPGLERISCSLSLGTPLATAMEQLERFAKEVMPAFKSGKIAAAAE